MNNPRLLWIAGLVNLFTFGINILVQNELMAVLNLLACGLCFTIYLHNKDTKDEE